VTRVGVVIPVGPGRAENLYDCLQRLQVQSYPIADLVCVFDGYDAFKDFSAFCQDRSIEEWQTAPRDLTSVVEQKVYTRAGQWLRIASQALVQHKHVPGKEQPRNSGVRALDVACDAVWFVDSDILFEADALEQHMARWQPGAVCMGPYDWMPPGVREPMPELQNDPRWPMFQEPRWSGPDVTLSVGELNVGLGCFSGNLIWDRREFERVGGFWSEIHHGRCEDGELGLRAVALGVPITCAPRARGWHMFHNVNHQLAVERNSRDVPMLNARHPWVQGDGLFVVDRDGKRFEERCDRCEQLVNTGEIWAHRASCTG
jgi:hypothetical protein